MTAPQLLAVALPVEPELPPSYRVSGLALPGLDPAFPSGFRRMD
jgi:hypothetical protein